MNDFVFQSPTRFVFGKSAIERTGEEVAALGSKRVLLVYGGGSARRTGLLSRVEDSLAKAGVAYVELGGVRPNPEVGLVRQGIEVARANSVDLVLGVGGGSVIDSAKAIAFGAPAPCDVWDFFSGKAKVTKCLPVACVLTIPAAGSEASSSCVISNDELCLKKGTNGDAFRPKVAIMDPTVTFTLPAYQTAAGVTDMICHVCERYFSAAGPVPVTDSICCGIIRSVIEAAVRVSHTPDDYDARATIMWAGTLAHNDLCGCGRGASIEKRAGGWESHGLEHEVCDGRDIDLLRMELPQVKENILYGVRQRRDVREHHHGRGALDRMHSPEDLVHILGRKRTRVLAPECQLLELLEEVLRLIQEHLDHRFMVCQSASPPMFSFPSHRFISTS